MVALGQDLLGTGTQRGPQPLSVATELLGKCCTLLEIGLKEHFSSLELYVGRHNMSWSDGQASSPRASHARLQQLLSCASSAGSSTPPCPKAQASVTSIAGT